MKERLTVNDLDTVCYAPWELCGMDRYCTKDCSERGGCANGCEIIKMYRKLAGYENLEEQGLLLKLPCKVGDTVYVSARSFGDINVQRIMEKLGGGGHFTVSGAQLKGCTTEEAKEQIRNAIEEYLKEETV